MKFKLFYGISVFNVFLLALVISYWIVTSFVTIDRTALTVVRYLIVGLVIGSVVLWLSLSYFVDCPHCCEQALRFNMDRSKEPKVDKATPTILRPLSFMIDDEYFAGYCHCKSCHEKITFSKEYAEANRKSA
ncbi:MAG: hypothetical protein ACFHVJ_11275 [Aestuariibacter sp.]